jgi:FkbM family methyltransferase
MPSCESDLIFDVGLHQAQDTRFYLAKGFRVVAIEASPELVEQARAQFPEELASGQLTIVEAAVAPEAGEVVLHLNEKSEWNTINADWNERNAVLGSPSTDTVRVRGVRFESLIEEHGVPYFLKIDIEGADMLCLEALEPPRVPQHVSIEADKLSWDGLRHEFEVLHELGYRRFKVVPQHTVGKQVPPKPAREGTYAATRFEHMCSGLFGEEAPGRWLTARQAMWKYRFLFLRYRLYGDRGRLRGTALGFALRQVLRGPGWYDTHATF